MPDSQWNLWKSQISFHHGLQISKVQIVGRNYPYPKGISAAEEILRNFWATVSKAANIFEVFWDIFLSHMGEQPWPCKNVLSASISL